MKKVLMLLTMFAVCVFFMPHAFAATCTQEEQLRLREVAAATQITYEFVKSTDVEGFSGYTVHISNFTSDLYVSDEEHAAYFDYNGTTIASAYDFVGGVTYNLSFYASKSNPCSGYLILNRSLELLPYNIYSEDPLCVGHETYELCKKFTPLVIGSRTEFEQRMNEYLNSLKKADSNKPTPENPKANPTILESIVSFFETNYMIFLIAIIVFGTSGIVYLEVKRRRSIL